MRCDGFELIIVTLVLLARLDVTVTGPEILTGLFTLAPIEHEPSDWAMDELPLGFKVVLCVPEGLTIDT